MLKNLSIISIVIINEEIEFLKVFKDIEMLYPEVNVKEN